MFNCSTVRHDSPGERTPNTRFIMMRRENQVYCTGLGFDFGLAHLCTDGYRATREAHTKFRPPSTHRDRQCTLAAAALHQNEAVSCHRVQG
jgi:hypothetical protein